MADMINIKDLAQKCALSAPVPKTISLTLDDGETCEAQVFVRRLTFASISEINKAISYKTTNNDIEITDIDAAKMQAIRVRQTICTDIKGTPLFETDNDVMGATIDLVTALYQVSDEVNNFAGKSKQVKSQPTNSLPS